MNSDPSPKATSVPPTTFKEGDRVRVKRFNRPGPDDTARISSLPIDHTGRIQVVLDVGGWREWCTPEELVPDVQPTTFKEGDRVRLKTSREHCYKVLKVDEAVGVLSDGLTSRRVTLRAPGSHETWDWEKNLEIVPDVAPATAFKECVEKGCPYQAEPNIDRCRGHEMGHPAPNNVDHPSHYTAGGIETITAIEAMVGQAGWSPLTGYRLGNVLKYLWRHAAKGGVESLKKARWYLDREIEQQEAAAPPKVTP